MSDPYHYPSGCWCRECMGVEPDEADEIDEQIEREMREREAYDQMQSKVRGEP